MIASTMKTAMAAMVIGCALAKPTLQDHVNEGYDVLLTPDQFSKLNPGSLHGMAGKCSTKKRNRKHMFVNGNLDTIEDCLKWCVNENVVEQRDIGACEYTEKDGKPVCTAFKASAFKDSKVTSSENHVGYKCYSLFSDGERRSARGLRVSNFWPNNELIYDIVDASDPNSWESNGHSQSSAIEYIDRAIAEYHAKTNVRFVKRTTEARYVSVGFFGGDCSSYVGNVFGGQRVTLGWCRSSLGSIIHEFGHALGMWHEHTRADRDTYLNVPSGANHNFDIANTDSRGIEYDFGSIMHYPLRTTWSDGRGGYTLCAAEGGKCKCVGKVRYGANEQFAYQLSTDSIACTNKAFGDPIKGTAKSCYCPGGATEFYTTVAMTLTTKGKSHLSEQGNSNIEIGQRVGLSQLDIDGLATVYPQLTTGLRFAAKGNGNAHSKNDAYAEEDNRFAVRCCSDTPIQGWKQKCNSYTASKAWDSGCQSKKTFSEAEDFCASVGGRLCTKDEVLSGCVKGTGCQFDFAQIWTSSIESAPGCKSRCVHSANLYPGATDFLPWKQKCALGGCNKCKACDSLD